MFFALFENHYINCHVYRFDLFSPREGNHENPDGQTVQLDGVMGNQVIGGKPCFLTSETEIINEVLCPLNYLKSKKARPRQENVLNKYETSVTSDAQVRYL